MNLQPTILSRGPAQKAPSLDFSSVRHILACGGVVSAAYGFVGLGLRIYTCIIYDAYIVYKQVFHNLSGTLENHVVKMRRLSLSFVTIIKVEVLN